MVEDEDDDFSTAGWDAIDTALAHIYPGVEPKHYGTLIKWTLGGPDPLDGISFYPREDHWHIVSYGMSELYDKESDLADESGWGFEFTFRVARDSAETEPPIWAANLLQNLARYVFSSGIPFGPGHHLDINGPIATAHPETAIRAITFVEDPELGAIDTAHGHLTFLQVVGLTLAEYAAIERWNSLLLVQVLEPHLPLLITDLNRADLTTHPEVAAAIEEGARRDGSMTGVLYVTDTGWTREADAVEVTFGANAAGRIGRVLASRLPFGRGVLIQAAETSIGLLAGDKLTFSDKGDGLLEIELPTMVLAELIAVLRPVAGHYHLASAPHLTVRIVKSKILDGEENVVEEIG